MEQNQKGGPVSVGTVYCGLIFGAIGVALAFMFLFLGFWKTIFVAFLFAVGYLMGAYSNKLAFVKSFINKLFPPKG